MEGISVGAGTGMFATGSATLYIDAAMRAHSAPQPEAVRMRDRDVRSALHRHLQDAHADDPSTLILDELGVCQGVARIDVAVINGEINGFEIKSEQDTLVRLTGQVEQYNKVFDTITIVTGPTHLEGVLSKVPDWWGICVATPQGGEVKIQPVRDGVSNPAPDPFAIAQLLWRDEALAVLASRGMDRGVRTKPRKAVWNRLASDLKLQDLRKAVRSALKARASWRSAKQPSPRGD